MNKIIIMFISFLTWFYPVFYFYKKLDITKKRLIDDLNTPCLSASKNQANGKYKPKINLNYCTMLLNYNNFVHLLILTDTVFFCCLISVKYVLCGYKQPLWCCRNAFIVSNKCNYALCSKCYLEKEREKKVKRSRRQISSNVCSNFNDPHYSNHLLANLKIFTDENYLDSTFLAKKIACGSIVPQQSSHCSLFITRMGNCHM